MGQFCARWSFISGIDAIHGEVCYRSMLAVVNLRCHQRWFYHHLDLAWSEEEPTWQKNRKVVDGGSKST